MLSIKDEEVTVLISTGFNGGLGISNKNEIGAIQKGSRRPPGGAAGVAARTAIQSSVMKQRNCNLDTKVWGCISFWNAVHHSTLYSDEANVGALKPK